MFLKSGDVFSGCTILSLCGRGAFGVTYLAKNPIGQKIAVKIVGSANRPERELHGIRNYMRIAGTHPNLLKVFHIGELDDGFYYTMEAADDCGNGEYVPATLGNLMRRGKRFTPEEAVKITRELLAGIQVMHDAGLIHRDLKPDNIIFVDGVAKISDPGLVIAEGETATFAGTPGFIPPEMLETGRSADKQGDLYALGKVFYCMITGYSPRRYPEFPPDMRIEVCRQVFPALSIMCNHNPGKRFRTAAEFLARLPEKIEKPTRWEKFRTDFRDWKTCNSGRARALFFGIAAAVLFLTAAVAALAAWQTRNARIAAERKQRIDAFLAVDRDRRELLDLQLEAYLPEEFARCRELRQAVADESSANDLARTEAHCEKLRSLLRGAAEKLLPELPAKPGDFGKGLAAVGAMHGFLSSPLVEYLDPAQKKACRDRLAACEKALFVDWNGPRCDMEWNDIQNSVRPMIFIPPGAVRMRHSGRIARIGYPFWMGKNEVIHEDFTFRLGITPQKSAFPNTPVERVSWNDVLFYCAQVTRLWKSNGQLPPGYIVRPPTEAEWEYAAGNAWLGADTAPIEEYAVLKTNSGGRTRPPGSRRPNKLGIQDIYGNVAEMVLPFEKPALQNAVMVRGGSFRSGPEQCFRQIPYLKEQYIPFDIGFRIVIAPGDMDYYDRHFYITGPMQARPKGKVWELIGGNIGSFTWEKSEELCRLLGGRLAEISNQQELDFLARNIPLAVSGWECFIGGKKIDGKWKWIHSGREIDFGNWYQTPNTDADPYLILRGKRWKAVKDLASAIFLCEWDEKDFAHRNDQLFSGKKLPRELMRFTIGDKTYMLIDSSMLWNAACRYCELLGGRLACPETPEERAALIRKLEPYRDRKIRLGGYAKRDQWFWLSGKPCDLELKEDKTVSVPSRNRNFVMLKDGEFWNGHYGHLILCEWPNSGPHPRTGDTPQ